MTDPSPGPGPVALPSVAPAAPLVPGSIGILGGTFDPIHHGHLAIAEEVRERLGLERVLFVPATRAAASVDRARRVRRGPHAMVRLAVADNPAFEVSRVELDRPGPSYSVDTVALLAGEVPAMGREPNLWFIASAEAIRGLPTWREPERLLGMTRFAVVPRAGAEPLDEAWLTARLPSAAGRLVLLDGPLMLVSGTVIRARAAVGRSLRYLVPEAVARYIGDHRLYRPETRRPSPRPNPPRRRIDRDRSRDLDPARRRVARPRRPGSVRRTGAARGGPADRRAGRGQEGGRHRPARAGAG